MAKIINFPKISEIPEITLQHTEGFYESAKQLSEFIKELPLNQQDNDKLIDLILNQVNDGMYDAFVQGFRMGRAYNEWEESEK